MLRPLPRARRRPRPGGQEGPARLRRSGAPSARASRPGTARSAPAARAGTSSARAIALEHLGAALRRPGRRQRPGLPAPRDERRARPGRRTRASRSPRPTCTPGWSAYDGEKMSKSQGNLVFVSALRDERRRPDGDPAGAAAPPLPHRLGVDRRAAAGTPSDTLAAAGARALALGAGAARRAGRRRRCWRRSPTTSTPRRALARRRRRGSTRPSADRPADGHRPRAAPALMRDGCSTPPLGARACDRGRRPASTPRLSRRPAALEVALELAGDRLAATPRGARRCRGSPRGRGRSRRRPRPPRRSSSTPRSQARASSGRSPSGMLASSRSSSGRAAPGWPWGRAAGRRSAGRPPSRTPRGCRAAAQASWKTPTMPVGPSYVDCSSSQPVDQLGLGGGAGDRDRPRVRGVGQQRTQGDDQLGRRGRRTRPAARRRTAATACWARCRGPG